MTRMNSMTPTPELRLAIREGRAVTTSRHVAESFGKEHRDVVRAITNAGCSPEFNARNFAQITYTDTRGRTQREIEMTRDGFCFVVMGFTGPEAARWKEAYIHAFNQMETHLAQVTTPPSVPAELLSAAQAELLSVQRELLRTLRQCVGLQRHVIRLQHRLLPPSRRVRPAGAGDSPQGQLFGQAA